MTREEAIRIIKIVLAVAADFEITVQGEEFTEEKCKEAVDMAIKALSSSEKPNKWIPVSERYPEDGQRVLVDYCDEDMGIMLMRFNAHGYRGFKAWMPLPDPYRQEVKE